MRDLRHFEDWLGSTTDVCSITPSMVARYMARRSDGVPAITLNRTKTALRVFFKFLTDAGYIETNPARLIRNHRSDPRPPRHLSSGEVHSLLATLRTDRDLAAQRDRAMFSLLLGTGMRLGSVVGLRVRDLDLKGRHVPIKAKNGVERKVYFNSELCRRLRTYIKTSELDP